MPTASTCHRLLYALVALLGLGLATSPALAADKDSPATQATATFAGGCFWCMEPPFDAIDGVISTTSGYIGGHKENPTYKEVTTGRTGHTEAVQIVYDPSKVSYAELLDVFWRNIDPTNPRVLFAGTWPTRRTSPCTCRTNAAAAKRSS